MGVVGAACNGGARGVASISRARRCQPPGSRCGIGRRANRWWGSRRGRATSSSWLPACALAKSRKMRTPAIFPSWPLRHVGALATTAAMGDIGSEAGRSELRALLPAEPRWLHQVHGARVIDADRTTTLMQAAAAVAPHPATASLVQIADCMPVLFADD